MLREHATNAQLASATAELRDAKEALRIVEYEYGVGLAELEAVAASMVEEDVSTAGEGLEESEESRGEHQPTQTSTSQRRRAPVNADEHRSTQTSTSQRRRAPVNADEHQSTQTPPRAVGFLARCRQHARGWRRRDRVAEGRPRGSAREPRRDSEGAHEQIEAIRQERDVLFKRSSLARAKEAAAVLEALEVESSAALLEELRGQLDALAIEKEDLGADVSGNEPIAWRRGRGTLLLG